MSKTTYKDTMLEAIEENFETVFEKNVKLHSFLEHKKRKLCFLFLILSALMYNLFLSWEQQDRRSIKIPRITQFVF